MEAGVRTQPPRLRRVLRHSQRRRRLLHARVTRRTGGGRDLWENLTPIERVGYLTDLLTDKAVEYVSRPHTRPFYLSLHYTAPHSPWEGPEDAAIGHTEHGPGPMTAGGSLKIYASMMKSMDAGIGRVLDALERAGLAGNTLVIFTSDNGGERYSFNWPFSFQKGFLWEGGLRVPAIVRWPGVVPAGRTTDQAAITMDWTATILGVSGTPAAPAHPLEGENLLPICTGRTHRLRPDALLAHQRPRRGATRQVEVPAGLGSGIALRFVD